MTSGNVYGSDKARDISARDSTRRTRLLTCLVNLSLRIPQQSRGKDDTMTDEPDNKKPEPRRPGGKTKRIAVTVALILFALLLLVLFLPVCGCAQTITGKVVGVSDGDTITVLDGQKRQHKIRLEGIDAPESSQDFGSRA